MENQAFDALARRAAGTASRRTFGMGALAGIAAAAIGLAGLLPADGAEARGKKKKKKKKKKKNKPPGPCQFDQTATMWTLRGNCTATETIELPDGVTLNGAGRTIFLEGTWSAFQFGVLSGGRMGAAGILAKGGNAGVRDLTLDGSRLSDSCTPETTGAAGIHFRETSGTIQRVTVRNVNAGTCSSGIAAASAGAVNVDVLDCTVVSCSRTAIDLDSTSTASTFTARRNDVRDAGKRGIATFGGTSDITDNRVEQVGEVGILVSDGNTPSAIASVTGNTVLDSEWGIGISSPATQATVSDNRLAGETDYGIGIQKSATATVWSNEIDGVWTGVYVLIDGYTWLRDNIITGGDLGGHGVHCESGGGGRIEENVISSFFLPDPDFSSCGIWLEEDAGPVTLIDNAFPDPGNERNICDYRTAGAAARRGGPTPVERRRDDTPIDDHSDFLGA